MQTDRYTKVVLTLIAIGLLLNAANNLATSPAFAYGETEVECVNCLTRSQLKDEMRRATVDVHVKNSVEVDVENSAHHPVPVDITNWPAKMTSDD